MANGYVPRMMRPPPFAPFPRAPPPQHHLPGSHPTLQQDPYSPSSLFASPNRNQPKCFFPPSTGPSIAQRILTTIFTPITTLTTHLNTIIHQCYIYVNNTIQDLRSTTHILLTPRDTDTTTTTTLLQILTSPHSWSLLIGLLVVIAFCVGSWFLAPKGENHTYVFPTKFNSLAIPSLLLPHTQGDADI
jgi:hypothetical protein